MRVVTRRGTVLSVLLAGALQVPAASAQEAAEPLLGEGTLLRTTLDVGVTHTDNFFYAQRSRETSGSGLLVSPELRLSRALPRFKFRSGAQGDFAWHDLSGDVDDYADYRLDLGAEWQPTLRGRFKFDTAFDSGHDAFGIERTEGTPLENRDLDQWRELRSSLRYYSGLPTDRLNFELVLAGLTRDYANNRAFTRFLDHHALSAELTTYYNVGPKTAVFATASGRRSRFDETAPGAFDRGATTMRYLLGSRWQATAKTHGDVRVGYIDRDPRDPGRDDFRRIDWRAELGWAPRTVTGLALATGRSSRESYINTVDFLDIRYVNLTWTEQWTQRAQTQLAASYQETDFVGSARKDELVGFSLGGEYLLTRDLKLRGYALNGHRDSPATFANYERSYVYLGIRYSR